LATLEAEVKKYAEETGRPFIVANYDLALGSATTFAGKAVYNYSTSYGNHLLLSDGLTITTEGYTENTSITAGGIDGVTDEADVLFSLLGGDDGHGGGIDPDLGRIQLDKGLVSTDRLDVIPQSRVAGHALHAAGSGKQENRDQHQRREGQTDDFFHEYPP
jgi:hypothetical protein